MATGWAYVGCSTSAAGAQGPSGSIQYHTGSTGLSGSAAFMITNAGPLEPYGARVALSGTLTVEGVISASHLHIENVTEINSTGSTYFGDTNDDLHARTGSFGVSTLSTSILWATASADAATPYVGIGTTAPSGSLHIEVGGNSAGVTPSTGYDDIVLATAGTAGMTIVVPDDAASGFVLGSTSDAYSSTWTHTYDDGYASFGTRVTGHELRLLSANGDVALTLGPLQSLTASQTISASAGLTGSALVVEHEVHAKTLSASLGISGSTLDIDNYISLTSDSSVFNMGAGNDFTITHDGTTGATISGTPITINSAGDLTLTSSADIVLDPAGTGVGIGTTSPAALTHIYKAATTLGNPAEMLRLEINDEGVDMNIGSGPSIDFYVGETGGSNYGGSVAVVREVAGDADSAAAMAFHTATDDEGPDNAREKMRITSTGKIGIGTTTPSHLFTVAGDIVASGSLTGSFGSYGAPTLFVTASGRVGIGLPTYGGSPTVPIEPSASLHISGSMAVHYFKVVGSEYTVAAKDYILGVSSSGAVTISLPSAAAMGAGRLILVKDEYYDGGTARDQANAITASAGVSGLIDGEANYYLYGSNQGSYSLYSDGVDKWFVV
jgi:hypothetical protein